MTKESASVASLEAQLKEVWALIQGMTEENAQLQKAMDEVRRAVHESREAINELRTQSMHDLGRVLNVQEATAEAVTKLDEHRASHAGRLDKAEELLHGRNRSAPSIRNMTEADAMEVLTGESAALGHKEAAEKIGLTYAQVYSARLEYTFKDAHKALREGGWKNPFVKAKK